MCSLIGVLNLHLPLKYPIKLPKLKKIIRNFLLKKKYIVQRYFGIRFVITCFVKITITKNTIIFFCLLMELNEKPLGKVRPIVTDMSTLFHQKHS